MEINKEAESQSLREVGEALESISQELKLVPSFSVVVQDTLREAIWKISEGVRLSSLFVNVVAGAKPKNKQPIGRLLDVALESLRSGRAPNYDVNDYGVFDHPSFTSREDINAQVPISAIEKLLADLLKKLAVDYTAVVRQYWENPSVGKAGGAYPQLTRKSALGVLEASLFAHELRALSIQGVITQQEAAVISATVQPGLTGTCYGVFIEGQNGKYIEQNAMFVLPLKVPVYEQLVSGEQGNVVLYSASHGLEVFSSTSRLEQTLLNRLGAPETQEAFLQALPLSQRAGFAYVPAIRFLKVRANLFEYYTDKLLRNVYIDIGQHLALLSTSDSDFDAIVALVESTQSLSGIPRQAKLRQASLLRSVQKNAWPLWLKETDQVNQEVYVALEQRLLESQVQYYEATEGVASLKEFVKEKVEDFISPGADERIDPDTVFANVTYLASLANGQKIEQRERKTLTQLFMYGIHDDAHQLQVSVEGQYYNSKLTQANLIHAIRTMNLRVAYNDARQAVFSKGHVFESLREMQGRQTALSLFAAVLRKHLNPRANDVLTRYNFGDLSLLGGRVALGEGFQSFKGVMVYRHKYSGIEQVFLYAPGFPSGQEWFEFAHIISLREQIAKWVTEDESWGYLQSQAIVSEIPKMTSHVTGDAWAPRRIAPSSLVFTYVTEDFPLENSIKGTLDWDSRQTEAITPTWYRKSRVEDQQLFNRFSTDLKLLSDFSKDTLSITPFHEFSRDVVMKTLHQYLRSAGRTTPIIDPDKVLVKFRAGPEMTLTNLFIQWQLWRSDVSVFEKVFNFTVIGGLFADFKEKLRTATFRSPTGHTIIELNAQTISDLIDLKPGEVYDKYLREKFLLAADRKLKENLYRKIKQNEMLRTALLQKINGTLSQEQFNWLQILIDGLDHDIPRKSVISTGGEPGKGVYEFTLQGRKIHGAYVFGRRFNGREERIVYVPGTHDGVDFFVLEKLADRLKKRHFTTDVSRLVRLEHKAIVENLMRRYWEWPIQATAAPTLTNSYPILSFNSEYSDMIGRFIADVDFQTTSSADAFWRDARILGEFALDIASMFVPPLGLALSVLRITQSVVQGVIASSQGDNIQANAHFASAWRGAIMLYLGKVSAIGAPVNPLGLLSQIKDFADLMTTVTGVPVTVSYLTAVAVPPPAINSTTRLIN